MRSADKEGFAKMITDERRLQNIIHDAAQWRMICQIVDAHRYKDERPIKQEAARVKSDDTSRNPGKQFA